MTEKGEIHMTPALRSVMAVRVANSLIISFGKMEYIHLRTRIHSYDREKYREMTLDAAQTILGFLALIEPVTATSRGIMAK